MKIGITGPIASGKSTAAKFLSECLSIPLIDADEIGHEILETQVIKNKLIKAFGKEILANNKIDRKKLGEIVFGNKNNLKALNDIFYPVFRKRLIEELKLRNNTIIEMAILHQYRLEKFLDTILFISAENDLRVNRLIKKGLSPEEARARVNGQNIRIKRGDILIENNFGSAVDFKKKLKKICNILG